MVKSHGLSMYPLLFPSEEVVGGPKVRTIIGTE